jgi:cyclohexa-1,5-dienecarbonyl-CoA hydratase
MSKAKLTFEHDNRVARVTLAVPKANIIDAAMMADLEAIFDQLLERRRLCAIVLGAEGPSFSYGASVEEHLPEKIGPTLKSLHGLLRRLSELPAPTIAAVRGQCLGGGLEFILACDIILAEESAQLGCPEIKLGVFPPAAAALLPVRLGAGRAASLVLTGESWSGSAASIAGLVSMVAPEGQLDAVLADCLKRDFLPRSPAALFHATQATRRPLRRALQMELPDLERIYLHDLMAEPDALEGLRAFLEKRQPRWNDKEDVE